MKLVKEEINILADKRVFKSVVTCPVIFSFDLLRDSSRQAGSSHNFPRSGGVWGDNAKVNVCILKRKRENKENVGALCVSGLLRCTSRFRVLGFSTFALS